MGEFFNKRIELIKKAYLRLLKYLAPIAYARQLGVRLGENCRLINVSFGSEPWLIKLGNDVSISDSRFITHDGGVWVLRKKRPAIDFVAPITVGNNVFIGSGTTILPGICIGDDVIIGAGSVVARNIPASCVAAGVPARVIRSLDEYQTNILANCDETKGFARRQIREFHRSKFSSFYDEN